MGKTRNGIGFGYRTGVASKGSLLNQLPIENLSSYFIGRSGLSLANTIGDATANILLSAYKCVSASTSIRTGIVPSINSIYVMRGSTIATNSTSEGNGAGFIFTSSDWGGMRYSIVWGDKTGLTYTTKYGTSNILVDGLWHTFIFYSGKLWIKSADFNPTDESIIAVILNDTPAINITGATWQNQVNQIILLTNYAYNFSMQNERALTYLGTITDNAITWQRKYVFSTNKNPYDILTGTKIPLLNSSGALSTGTAPSRVFSAYGWDTLQGGHTSAYLAGSGIISVPKSENGFITDLPTGYVKLQDENGDNSFHNLADSLIVFSDALFDRSNALIWKDAARAATTFYDAANPKRFHISELNNLVFNEWLQPDYLGRIFVKVTPNSVDVEDRLLLKEIFTYSVNKTGADYEAVLKYTNDFNLVIL